MSFKYNPFSGILDIVGLTSTIADGLYIRKDGTSVTSATIPFAQGVDITGTLDINNDSTPVYIHCPSGATVFGIRFDGGYSDCIRFDGAVGTTDSSISNLFAINDNSIAIPIANGKTFWSYGAAQALGTGFNVNQMIGFLSSPFSTSLRGNYSGILTDLIFYEVQPLFTVGTVTNAYGFHMGAPNFSGCALSNFYGIYLPDITAGSSINRAIRTGAGQVEFGDNLIWTTDNSKDIGASGATRPRTGYFGTNVSSPIFTSTVATGTAPFTVSSTTNVANLNASSLTGSAIGTSGATIPLLSTSNTWSATQTTRDISLNNSLGVGFSILCTVDNSSSLGSSSKRFGSIFFGGNLGDGTITTTLANLARLDTANTFTKSQTISMTTPTLILIDSAGDDYNINVTAGILAIRNTTDSRNDFITDAAGGVAVAGASALSTTFLNLPASTTARSSLGVPAGTSPTSPVTGDVWNDSTQNMMTFFNGNKLYQAGNLYTATADVTINTTTPTSAHSGTAIGTTTIKANTLKVGQKFAIWGAGSYSTPLANTSTVTITVKIGATTISTVTTGALPASASNLPFDFLLQFTIRGTGASATLVADGTFNYATALSAVAKTSNSLSTVGTITFDSTADKAMDVLASWSAVTTQTATVQQSKIDFL